MAELIVAAATWVIVGYSLCLALVYFGLAATASRDLRDVERARRSAPPSDLFALPLTPPISVLAPAFNEEAGIVESVSSLLSLSYPELEVVVISDGSTDGTLARLAEAFALEPFDRVLQDAIETAPVRGVFRSNLHPNLIVIDKENGGKADALNVGINAARYPLVCSIDADSILESDALLKSVTPMVHRPGLTIATGGIVRIANGAEFDGGALVKTGVPKGLLARFQLVEYLRAFIVGRAGWSRLKSLLIISGAFGVFRRDVLLEVGGYRADTVGEDMELIVRLHRHMRERNRPYRIEFIPDPVCWTEAPESLGILRKQRTRWQRGLFDTLRIHRDMMLRPRYGRLGMVAMPYFVAFEFLGPVVEVFGIVLSSWFAWQGLLHPGYALLLVATAIGVGVILSIASLVFEEAAYHRYPQWRQTAALLTFAVLENFGYRQLTAWWRLVGLWQGFRGRGSWGAMTRTGKLGSKATGLDTVPSDYLELRESISQLGTARDEPALAKAQAAATTTPPIPIESSRAPQSSPGGAGRPTRGVRRIEAPDAEEPNTAAPAARYRVTESRRRRKRRTWDPLRLYTPAICREFAQELSDDVLERSQWLFRSLWRIGYVDSKQLAELMGCNPSSLSGLVTTPISRHAKDLGLPLPYVVARMPSDRRRIWRDQGNIASRMTIAIHQEISSRERR